MASFTDKQRRTLMRRYYGKRPSEMNHIHLGRDRVYLKQQKKPSMAGIRFNVSIWTFNLVFHGGALIFGYGLLLLSAAITLASIFFLGLASKQIDKCYEQIKDWERQRLTNWLDSSLSRETAEVDWETFEKRVEKALAHDPFGPLDRPAIEGMIAYSEVAAEQERRKRSLPCRHAQTDRILVVDKAYYFCVDCGEDLTDESPKQKILNIFKVPSHHLGDRPRDDTSQAQLD